MTDCGGDVFHDQGSAVIMIAYSTCAVYAVCNVQVLGKESHGGEQTSRTMRREEGSGSIREVRDDAIHVENSHHLHGVQVAADP